MILLNIFFYLKFYYLLSLFYSKDNWKERPNIIIIFEEVLFYKYSIPWTFISSSSSSSGSAPMAVGFDVSGATTSVYNGRMTIFVVMSCLMAAMGGLIFGYDIGISGLSLSLFLFLQAFA